MPKKTWMPGLLALLLAGGCTGIPKGVTPVSGFDLERYLGRWYEIARLDHSFERGLTRVTADYSRRPKGGVQVVNRGYDAAKDEWREARGVAHFVGQPEVGHLKVSFFRPFYGGYVIAELDADHYQYALVCGPTREYLWLLAREPVLDEAVRERLLARAAELGFATDQLLFITHD